MIKMLAGSVLGFLIAFSAINDARAEAFSATTPRIFMSGHTYHIAVCNEAPRIGYARCHSHMVTDRTGRPLLDRFGPNRVERTARTNLIPDGFGPLALNLAYNPGVVARYPNVGTPSTLIAIVDAYGYPEAERDLGVYRSLYGLPLCTTANGCFSRVNQNGTKGSYPQANVNWEDESALDLDMASAMCPRCKILLVEANDSTIGNLSASVETAVRLGAHVVSNSYGGPEPGSSALNSRYNHPGVAITASTGDNGYAGGVQFPATSQYVTAVGGTGLYFSPAAGYYELVWTDGGSGCSKVYPKPAWQAFIKLCTKRMDADISAVADPNTGVAVYAPSSGSTSHWVELGGTSAAAPLIGGLYGAKGGTVKFGSLYKAGVYGDVVVGNNGSCGGTLFCNAEHGYDGPTGLGTPRNIAGF